MTRPNVLSTKTLDETSIGILQRSNIDVIEKDLISISPSLTPGSIEEIKKAGNKTVVFTSSNAVHAVKGLVHDVLLDVFCMEGKTKTAVQENLSKANIIATASDARSIAGKIIDSGVKQLTFFCGNNRRDELPDLLKQNDVVVNEIIVYSTEETPLRISEKFDAVMFFSPSAVRSFFTKNQLNEKQTCFSIGNTTAEEIKKFTNNHIVVATTPSEGSLAISVIEHYKNNTQSKSSGVH